MSSVTVLAPNARREQIKVQPSTKILEIIEEVCKKHGLDSNEFDIIHQRRRLDITSTFHLSGVPKNAQLELKKLDIPRKIGDVTIAFQIEDGSRLPPLTFKPTDTTLFKVIESYVESNACDALKEALVETVSDKYPTCSYLNEMITGIYQLKNTTLKDLGLTNGRAVIRFFFKTMDANELKKLDDDFKAKLDKSQKLQQVFQAKQQLVKEDTTKMEPTVIEKEASQTEKIDYPDEKRQRLEENEFKSNQSSKITSDKINNEARSQITVQPPSVNEFASFKFPEETKGKQLNDINELAEIERLSKEACDREGIIYSMDASNAEKNNNENQGDLSDEFFDVTVNDLRYALSDLKRLQSDNQPLMTKAMKELEQDKKAMRYSKVVIRIAFKNRLVLQGFFRPKESISALYKFVKENLSEENNTTDLDFYLFSTPPKQILNNMKANLFESHLCPASLIYFKNQSDNVPVFKKSLIENFKTIEQANELVNVNVHQGIREISHEGMDWLVKEQSVIQNVLKQGQGMASQHKETRSVEYESQQRTGAQEIDPVKKKLEKFLGKK